MFDSVSQFAEQELDKLMQTISDRVEAELVAEAEALCTAHAELEWKVSTYETGWLTA